MTNAITQPTSEQVKGLASAERTESTNRRRRVSRASKRAARRLAAPRHGYPRAAGRTRPLRLDLSCVRAVQVIAVATARQDRLEAGDGRRRSPNDRTSASAADLGGIVRRVGLPSHLARRVRRPARTIRPGVFASPGRRVAIAAPAVMYPGRGRRVGSAGFSRRPIGSVRLAHREIRPGPIEVGPISAQARPSSARSSSARSSSARSSSAQPFPLRAGATRADPLCGTGAARGVIRDTAAAATSCGSADPVAAAGAAAGGRNSMPPELASSGACSARPAGVEAAARVTCPSSRALRPRERSLGMARSSSATTAAAVIPTNTSTGWP